MFDAALLDDDIAGDALAGLRATPKTLPPKLFYDEQGVALFDAITRLPEYYVTRTERALLERIAPELVALARPRTALVEYGACDEGKAVLLLDQAAAPFSAYVPVDVARGALEAVSARMAISHPWLDVATVCGDFMRGVRLPESVRGRPLMGFFPGSTIGNLDPDAAVAFLQGVRETLGENGGSDGLLVVGADIRKGSDVLLPAYDDAQGVTAAFNLNVLRRLNREAGADFDLSQFRHVARWNDALSRVEMHLESLARQTVCVGGVSIPFAAGETIHTENSYKHSLAAFDTLVRRAGWQPVRSWTDARGWFGVHVLRGR
jgi:dimethylhistidine N-methyltransferase